MGEAVFREGGSTESAREVTSREIPIIAPFPTATEPTNIHPDCHPGRGGRCLFSTQFAEELSLENKEIRILSA